MVSPKRAAQVCETYEGEPTMQFGLSESQQILKDTARKFFAGECPSAEVRKLMGPARLT